MSELDCLLSLSLCCFACKDCVECVDSVDTNSYKKIDDEKEKDVLKVIFFYDENDNRIDKNINRIIFYEEYKKGYYNHNNKCDANKNILLIQNKNNDIKEISSIINFIHSNKGLSLNNNKWFPKYIWVYN